MTTIINRASPFIANPIPRWVGIYYCKHCGSISDIGEDWKWDAYISPPCGSIPEMWDVKCPVCKHGMDKSSFRETMHSNERDKSIFMRNYPTFWSRVRARWFG